MNIGIFAGTFDPIHDGHLSFAQTACKEAKLDKVIIVAEKDPYRKKPFASWDDRQAMIERATEATENVDHDYQFANKLAHQHTIQDMLLVTKDHFNDEATVWFLVGSDIFEHMAKWRDVVDRRNYGGFVVALRDDHTETWLRQKVAELPHSIKYVVVKNVYPFVSSGQLRTQAKDNALYSGTPEKVIEYISSHNLYKIT